MYQYKIEEGHESRIFANARNLGNGIVESDVPLTSKYLTLIEEKKVEQSPPNPTPPASVNQQVSPTLPPSNTPQNAPAANKEASV